MDFFSEIKQLFQQGGILIKLIIINISVFLLINLWKVFFFLSGNPEPFSLLSLFAVPASLHHLAVLPWTPLTYMFLHADLLHIFFNMLVLYWFGKFFLQTLSERQLVTAYISGGLSGAFFFIAFYNLFPVFYDMLPESVALGASASVMAIMVISTYFQPDYFFNILFIGPVKAKYFALALVLLDLISIAGDNSGGHIAHLGGAIWGFFFARYFLKPSSSGTVTGPFLRFFGSKRKPKVSYRNNLPPVDDYAYAAWKAENQKEIDRILDKISRSGYQSLSSAEKETLFKMNKDNP